MALLKKAIKIKLGKKYVDPITGFEGIATQKTEYLYGCERVSLQPPVDKDGKVPEAEYFDELQLREIKPDKVLGGPQKMTIDKRDRPTR